MPRFEGACGARGGAPLRGRVDRLEAPASSEQRAIVRTGRGASMQRREGGKGSYGCCDRGSMGSSIASSVGAPHSRGAARTPPATRVGEQLLSRSAQRAVLPCRRAGWFLENF